MTNLDEEEGLPDYTGLPDGFPEMLMQVVALTERLEAAKDPAYEAGLRRTVPSTQQLHSVRLLAVRRIARDWLKERQHAPVQQNLEVAEMLWSTAWREERLVAIFIIVGDERAMDAVDFKLLERWSRDIDNWELIDQLAAITGKLLERNPRLLTSVRGLANSDSPWQRRLALATMIVASRDEAWLPGLANMIERLSMDNDPYVKKAITWARDSLKKRQAKLG